MKILSRLETRLKRRVSAWLSEILDPELLGLQLLNAQAKPSPSTVVRRVVLLASHAPPDDNIAVLWIAIWPRLVLSPLSSSRPITYICQYEKIRGRWSSLGVCNPMPEPGFLDKRPSLSSSGPANLLVRGASGGSRNNASHTSLARSAIALTTRHDNNDVTWVGYEIYRVSAEVAHLEIAHRPVTVSPHGYSIITWRSRDRDDLTSRPEIKAIAADGSILAELHPGDYLDSLTLAALRERLSDGQYVNDEDQGVGPLDAR